MMWYLLSANTTSAFTHADTLRGSNGRGRNWWAVQRYDLRVSFDTLDQAISGVNTIAFAVTTPPSDSMQIDLQEPMILDNATINGNKITIANEGNVWWLKYPFHELKTGTQSEIALNYHGTPRKAVNPPWDGGFSWKHDSVGNQWIAVSCQGLGASVWWPCKDAQWEEPQQGMDIELTAPGNLQAISNGRLVNTQQGVGGTIFHWNVRNPINNYDVSFYVGDYVHWHDTLMGEKGLLDLDYWVLRYNEERAKKQFAIVKTMIHCFEYWMSPYPFYEDGYKLVEAPYLGMEHQGAIAYGNKYKMGYLGFDRTLTGIGLKFDYIIVHESGHEWFGNNVTAKDIADNWIHEGITTYSESLFTECTQGTEKGQQYCRGEWHNIENDKPIIGSYGVNEEGSNDMYDKGAAMMYMIRVLTHDDEKFRQMLRGLGQEFYHKTVTTTEVEKYISAHTGLDLSLFFDQYLRNKDIPVLAYTIKKKKLKFRFTNTAEGFTLPISIKVGGESQTINPGTEWQHIKKKKRSSVAFSEDFLIKRVKNK